MTLFGNSSSYPSLTDRISIGFLWLMAILASSIVGFILFFLVLESIPFLWHKGAWSLFSHAAWYPSEGQYNLLPMLVGSLLIMLGAVTLAAPLGIVSAIFCHYYASPGLAKQFRRMIQLLAGIPSVVFGFWGLVELVPLIRQINPPGVSLLAGVLVITLMILPTMTLIVDASLSSVPKEYLEGAIALGLTRWTTIIKVIVPAIKSSIFTGMILSAGRAIGETMAVVMICGNIVQIPGSLFDPVRTLTANIALEMAYAMGDHRAALFVTGLLLTGLVGLFVVFTEIIKKDKRHV